MARTTTLLTLASACAAATACSRPSGSEAVAGVRPSPALAAASVQPTADPVDLRSRHLDNPTAYIPPQCYTNTRDGQGNVHNPCYACHQHSRRPNFIDDWDVQLSYALPGPALENPWTNLFVDRRAEVAAISDAEILAWVRADNYHDDDGGLRLARRLSEVPEEWDFDGDGEWAGFRPDAYFRFDGDGFDLDPAGKRTGWRAFAYYPFPGTFWPTNGSAGDVLIRLPSAFRTNVEGEADDRVYATNLAILEALAKREDVPIPPTDEKALGVDLDRDGRLRTAERVTFSWAPTKGKHMEYVGRAGQLLSEGKVHLAAGLLPVGTEFLHSVRYLDPPESSARDLVGMAPRMKELRYARKRRWLTYSDLDEAAAEEIKSKDDFPDRTRQIFGDVEHGVSNGQGWVYQGFIEDRRGELRPQTFEESVFCVGCHSGVGATTDGVFSWARKLPASGPSGGWFHWTQRGLRGIPEPTRTDGAGEYTLYLAEAGAGDEFRGNREVISRFFDPSGALDPEAIFRLREDVSYLLLPSPDRALLLDKAYRVLVGEQSYVRGRDATVEPVANVHRRLEADHETGIRDPVAGPDD
jgi:hypothetical protein